MRILHLSDLHICAEANQSLVRQVELRLNELSSGFKLEFPTEADLKALETGVRHEDPDVICITGDVTTFGDTASFDRAKLFVDSIANRADGRPRRHVLVIPGNHDALVENLRRLLQDPTELSRLVGPPSDWKGRLLMGLAALLYRGLHSELQRLLDQIEPEVKSPLQNFKAFRGAVSTGAEEDHFLSDVDGPKVLIAGHDSSGRDILTANQGASNPDSLNRLRELFGGRADFVKIALLHHNPLSSPNVIDDPIAFAFSSMPAGSAFVREMQNSGADLVLFGHQHATNCCLVEFLPNQPGHLFLTGAASATTGGQQGFNILEIKDRHTGQLRHCHRTAAGTHYTSDRVGISLVFEKASVTDQMTVCAQREVRHYRVREDESEWDTMLTDASGDDEELLLVGPRQTDLAVEIQSRRLVEKIKRKGTKSVGILLADPDLYTTLAGVTAEQKRKLNKMWDCAEDYSWENQSKDAADVVAKLKTMASKLEPGDRKKIDFRLSGVMMPLGARARNLNHPDGAMLIRLLPVGMFSELYRPELRLERRHHLALYEYYSKYLTLLFDRATKVDLV